MEGHLCAGTSKLVPTQSPHWGQRFLPRAGIYALPAWHWDCQHTIPASRPLDAQVWSMPHSLTSWHCPDITSDRDTVKDGLSPAGHRCPFASCKHSLLVAGKALARQYHTMDVPFPSQVSRDVVQSEGGPGTRLGKGMPAASLKPYLQTSPFPRCLQPLLSLLCLPFPAASSTGTVVERFWGQEDAFSSSAHQPRRGKGPNHRRDQPAPLPPLLSFLFPPCQRGGPKPGPLGLGTLRLQSLPSRGISPPLHFIYCFHSFLTELCEDFELKKKNEKKKKDCVCFLVGYQPELN